MARPFICIPSRAQTDAEGINPAFSGVYDSYLRAVETAGGTPVIIPAALGLGTADALYERSEGLLLIGGEDVDPKHYGEDPHPKLGRTSADRDRTELHLIRRAWAEKKPILAICRGVQMLNVALGGSLYQDIADQFPSSVEHRDSKGRHTWLELRHTITVEKGTALAAAVGDGELPTNSLHHQAVKVLGKGLVVSARSPDGLIEGVEASDERFCIGVQCHPEALWEKIEPRWARLFAVFVAACLR